MFLSIKRVDFMLDAANIFLSLGANAILSLFITIFVHNNQSQSFF